MSDAELIEVLQNSPWEQAKRSNTIQEEIAAIRAEIINIRTRIAIWKAILESDHNQ